MGDDDNLAWRGHLSRLRFRKLWILHAVLAVAAVVAFHAGTILHLRSEVLGDPGGDMIGFFYSRIYWLQHTLNAGRLPLWNPLIFCGFPQWAEASSVSVIGPASPFLLMAPTAVANLWWISIHVLVALSAMWWLASMRIAPLAALLGSLAIAFSSPVVYHIAGGHPNLVACFPWFFFLVGAWNRWWDGRGRHYLLVAAAAWSLLLWSCFIQGAYELTLWWLLLTLVCHGIEGKRALVRWGRGVAFVLCLGTLATGAQLFPQFEFAMVSSRSGLDIYESSTYNFPLENLLTLFIPGCFGVGVSPATGSATPYMGRWYFAWEESLLLNPVILGCLLLPWPRRNRRMVGGLVVACGASFILALGRQTPVYYLAYHFLPGFRLFRCHARQMAPVLFGIVAVACMMFDQFIRRPQRGGSGSRRNLVWLGWPICAGSLLLLIVAHYFPTSLPGSLFGAMASLPLSGPSLELFPALPPGATLSYFSDIFKAAERGRVFVNAAVFTVAGWIILLGLCAAIMRMKGLGRPLIALLIICGVGVSFWDASPCALRMVASGLNFPKSCTDGMRPLTKSGRALLMGASDRNQLVLDEIPSASGYSALIGQRQNDLLRAAFNHGPRSLENNDNASELTPQARWLGISVLASSDPTISPSPSFKLIKEEGQNQAWSVPDPMPLAFVTTGGLAVASYSAAVEQLKTASDAVGAPLILETSDKLEPSTNSFMPLALERPSPTRIHVNLSGAPAGWVVVLESLLPGWKALLDGRAVPIVPAQVAFQGVKIPQGAKELNLAYEPASFRFGVFVSLLTGLFIALLTLSKGSGGAWHRRLPALQSNGRDSRKRRSSRASESRNLPQRRERKPRRK